MRSRYVPGEIERKLLVCSDVDEPKLKVGEVSVAMLVAGSVT